MLKKIVNSTMILSVCLLAGYAKPLVECKNDKDKIDGCIDRWYYESGGLKYETPYKDGKSHGIDKSYWENGKLLYETIYENDKKNGIEKWYWSNGQLQHEIP